MNKIVDAKLIKSNTCGIYLILSPSGNKYVGQSVCLKKRLIDHKCPSRKNLEYKISKEFKNYPLDLFRYEILETCDEAELNEREAFWIKKINPELNISSGGYAHSGCTLSSTTKKILSEKGKAQWDRKTDEEKENIIRQNLKGRSKGFSHSEKTKEKISSSLTGKKQSEQTKERRSKAMKKSMIGNKNGNRKVSSYKDGNLINTFDSLLDASIAVGIDSSGISKVLSGRQNTAGGFYWKFSE